MTRHLQRSSKAFCVWPRWAQFASKALAVSTVIIIVIISSLFSVPSAIIMVRPLTETAACGRRDIITNNAGVRCNVQPQPREEVFENIT